MNGRKALVLGAACAALIAAIFFINKSPPDSARTSASPEQSESPTTTIAPAADTTHVASVDPSRSDTDASVAATEENVADGQTFHVDAAGNLVLNEQTRLNIEALVAQIEPREWDAAIREQIEHLPPAAARLAQDLIDRFVNYQQAQKQAYPPGDVPATLEDAVIQLEGLHALREAHFGPEVARAFYGNEEIIAREMIEVMRIENDQSLTPEEKAERARALRERLPGVSAIDKSNRDFDAVQRK
jgi:lipase chaperone LimK